MKRIKNKYINMIMFYFKHGLNPLSNIVLFICPFLVLYNYMLLGNAKKSIILAFLLMAISYGLKVVAEVKNVGKDLPIPYKRFTTDDEYNGITVNKDDLNDVIIYVNDLENWLEREGYTKSTMYELANPIETVEDWLKKKGLIGHD